MQSGLATSPLIIRFHVEMSIALEFFSTVRTGQYFFAKDQNGKNNEPIDPRMIDKKYLREPGLWFILSFP
jgi:hypothetical protein